MLGLRTWHRQGAAFPVDIGPFERQVLGGASQAAIAAQGNQELPLRIRAGGNGAVDHVAGDEEFAGGVALLASLDAGEGIVGEVFPADGFVEDVPRAQDAAGHGGGGEAAGLGVGL
ncbi:MAG TPA: hypothetical protein VH253_17000 [Phycisphaerae bacterium]|nr:hypothetical protein [Phycisphaerae bacterium]